MKNQKSKSNISATTVTLVLLFAMTFSLIALPAVNAQINLIMNLPGDDIAPYNVELHESIDIDVNGQHPGGTIELWVKYPGRTDFTFVQAYPDRAPGSDLDVYDFDFNETGDYELKWMIGSASSNVAPAKCWPIGGVPPTIVNYTSYVYVAVAQEVIGLGQSNLLVMWTADMPHDIGELAGTVPGGRAAWYDVGFYLTDPEGITQTLTIAKTDPVGGGWINYTPDKLGTYTVKAWFPETWKNGTRMHEVYTADESPEVTFTVQAEPVPNWIESPLPTGYWTRPINQASREWGVLGGNWLRSSETIRPVGTYGGTTDRFIYGKATESAHILWSKPYYLGGIMDAKFGNIGYQTGHYQGMSFSAIVLNGKMYYAPRVDGHHTAGFLVVDLYTGETLSSEDERMPAFGQIYDYESPNQHGGYAYLYRTAGVTLPEENSNPDGPNGTVWQMLDGYTLNPICYIANVSSSGRAVISKDGSILRYNIRNIGGTPYLQVWNTSAIDTMTAAEGQETAAWQWRPSGGGFGGGPGFRDNYYVHDGNTGFSLNVSIPNIASTSIMAVREGEFIIVGSNTIMAAYSLEEGSEGTKLWETTITPPTNLPGSSWSRTGVYPDSGVILYEDKKNLLRCGVSLETGQQVWMGDPEPQMNYYSMYDNYYQGLLLSPSWSGKIIAYNASTGERAWEYDARNIGLESPYGNYPINIFGIADGKIYTLTGEHSISQPMYRGPNIRCINATTGEEIWKILGFSANGGASLGGQYAQLGDGKVLALNYFDNQIYCFGEGNSATTVEAPRTGLPLGSSVMITGTVTDETSTGRRNTNDMFDFTLKGTPAISDEDMGAWMEYMFMQQIYPADAKGVTVKLTAIDPNGNYQDIGEVTSDISGNFGKSWVPPVQGEYHVTATFEGSAAYGSSSATCYFVVDDAPSPGTSIEPEPATPAPTTPEPTTPEPTTPEPTTPEPTTPEPTTPEPTEPEPTEPAEAPFITTEIAILAAVAVACVIGVVSYWALKKRK